MRVSMIVLAATFVACARSPKPGATPVAGALAAAAPSPNALAALPPAKPTTTGDFDHDGIADGADLCPHDAEDVDGFEDQDGCPDPDNDRDGIPDASDRCPDAAEIFNGVDDQDGCPDVGRVVKMIGPCKLEILDKILFAKNAATVPPKATSLLDAIARTLERNPEISSVEVQGHASRDERGPDRLARARGSAVLEYLVTKGVSRERLMLGAYAAERPAPRGKWESALILSRRVEFSIRDRKPE
jgi:outer membrane protein OmpA-like peptidoglycan-associated protein